MANILVYIELEADRPAAASLEALGEGRRIASQLGATLYAVATCVDPPRYGDDDLIAMVSRHGADKVVIVAGPELDGPLLYATHGQALGSVCDQIDPSLLILAATPGGRDLAPRLAARADAAFVAETRLEVGPQGELIVSRPIYGGAFERRLVADEVERPIVVTMTPGAFAPATGDEEAEVIMVQAQPLTEKKAVEVLGHEPDPGAVLERARIIVTAGAGVGEEVYPLLRELASLLGGELAVTRDALAKGLGTPDREVGIGGRSVSPRVYIACGASGSPAHLGAVSSESEIVAINRDPDAPIFRAAAYGMVGDVGDVVGRMIAELRGGAP